MRHTASGTAVVTFSLATDEQWKDQSGEKQRRTEWHNIVVWNKLAETCQKFLTKGKMVYIEGRIQTREWDDRDGNKRRTTEIVASDMRILEKKSEGAGDSDYAGAGPVTAKPMDAGITDNDVPF
jgi:single-strand DNA-binding protein